jgi:hypothetical protein
MFKLINPWQTLSSRVVFKNQWHTLYEDSVTKPNGMQGTYTYVKSPPFVLIVGMIVGVLYWFVNIVIP